MSSKRTALANNPNVANSPLRGASALAAYAKQKRSHATMQREETYGQLQPTGKRLAVDNGTRKPVRSPSKLASTQSSHPVTTTLAQRTAARGSATTRDKTAMTQEARDTQRQDWKKYYRARFPSMVFYFESIPDDVRARLTKKVLQLGGRQEPFFSIDVTHVVTTRPIPPERSHEPENDRMTQDATEHTEETQHPQTINPSLLDRNTSGRRLLFGLDSGASRAQSLDDAAKRGGRTARNSDVLHKAREMGKKIYSLEKFQHIMSVLLESDQVPGPRATRSTSTRDQSGASTQVGETNLVQLLNNERINGPSDRDPTAVSRELTYFKGPFIFIWDMEEKQKPIMVREYGKVARKEDGEWPQFRSVGNGRCPFVEDVEPVVEQRRPRAAKKPQVVTAAQDTSAKNVKSAAVSDAKTKPVTGAKRTLAEMQGTSHNVDRAAPAAVVKPDGLTPAEAAIPRQTEPPKPQNAFISRAEGGRLHAGEPVASGMQPSNVTSAIRSQMISSTSGLHGTKAGTSKEIHGLQRKVLQKATSITSHEASSRRLQEVSIDVASSRSTMSRQNSRTTTGQEDDKAASGQQRTQSQTQSQSLKSKKDLKPGYCENCQDRYKDFDEHILSRKHRKFAENDDNWGELDDLLSQLERAPKPYLAYNEVEEEEAVELQW